MNRGRGGLGTGADAPGVDVGVVVGGAAVTVRVGSGVLVGGAAVNVGGWVWFGFGVPSTAARTRGTISTPIASAPM